MQALASGNPVALGFPVFSDFMSLRSHTVYSTVTGTNLGGHMAYHQAMGANHAEGYPHIGPGDWTDVGPADELPEGEPTRRIIGDVGVLVVRGVLTEEEVELAREGIEAVLAAGGMLTQVASGRSRPAPRSISCARPRGAAWR